MTLKFKFRSVSDAVRVMEALKERDRLKEINRELIESLKDITNELIHLVQNDELDSMIKDTLKLIAKAEGGNV